MLVDQRFQTRLFPHASAFSTAVSAFVFLLAISQTPSHALDLTKQNLAAVPPGVITPGRKSPVGVDPIGPAGVPLRGPMALPLSIDQAMSETLTGSPRAASLRLQLGIAKSGLIRATELPNPSIFMDNGYRLNFGKFIFSLSRRREPMGSTSSDIEVEAMHRKAGDGLIVARAG